MRKMSDELLLHSYKKAISLQSIDEEFLELLEEEMARRGLVTQRVNR